MLNRQRWHRTVRVTIASLALLASGCGQFEAALKRLTGGSEGTTKANAAVHGLGHVGENPLGARVAPPTAASNVARYLALRVEGNDAELGFTMTAPLEHIRGSISTLSGKLMVNPEALSEMTGVFSADLSTLELFQSTRSSEQAGFAPETRNTLQNEHARNWLEIGADVPAAQRDLNRRVEFRPSKVEVTGAQTLSALAKPGTSSTLRVHGQITIHGLTRSIETELLLTADITNGQLNGLHFKSTNPVSIDLTSFAIEPRDGFGKLAQKTLSALAPRVAKEALVSFACVARPHSD